MNSGGLKSICLGNYKDENIGDDLSQIKGKGYDKKNFKEILMTNENSLFLVVTTDFKGEQ